ncbi:MAG: hypothetical protein QM477_09495 [Planctomycetota bacterium]
MRILLFLLLFVCGFVFANAGIGHWLPESQKLEWLKTQKDQVDVIFLGSSHIFHQFDPSTFDAARGEGRSLNMGASGMGVREQLYLVERILAMHPKRLDWLVLEGLPWSAAMQVENDFGLRRLQWHNASVTLFSVKAAWFGDAPWSDRWDQVQRHLQHWWRRSLHIARGMDAIRAFRKPGLLAYADQKDLGPARDGFLPLVVSEVGEKGRVNRESFLANPQKLFAARARLPQAGDGGAADPALVEAVVRIQQLASQQGVQVVWWLHPNLGRTPGWHRMDTDGVLDHFIAFDDPERFPEFYKVGWHFDLFHLTKKGSKKLTAAFAQDFQALDSALDFTEGED